MNAPNNIVIFGLFLVQCFVSASVNASAQDLPWLSGSNSISIDNVESGQWAQDVGIEISAPAVFKGNAATNSQLDLYQAISMAVARHPSITAAVQSIAQQEGLVGVAESSYYPQVSAGVSSGRSSSNGHSQVATLSLSQMLYDFGKTDGDVTSAEGQVLRQQALLLTQIDSISQETAEVYVAVHRYQVLLEISRQQVKAIEGVLQAAQLRANSGLSSQADPIQARTRLESAQANLIQVESQLAQWREQLAILLGVRLPEAVAAVPSDLETKAKLHIPLDYTRLPDVLVAQADLQVAEGQLSAAEAQHYPTIALEGSVNQALSGTNPNNGEERGSYNTIALTGSLSLYQGGAVSSRIRAARMGMEVAESAIKQARMTTDMQVNSSREQIFGVHKRLTVLTQRKATMGETREMYREQYTVGTRSVLDLLNAEQEVHQAAADEQDAKHDYLLGLITFIGATGRSRDAYELSNLAVHAGVIQP